MVSFLIKIIEYFAANNIPYMLSGSVAMSTYVLPRATRDFDFVVHLQQKDVAAFAAYFKEGHYCDADAVLDAVKRQSMFNIIDFASGFKADFVILKNEPFRLAEFGRRVKTDFEGIPIYIVTAEDLLISKLIWIQEIQSSVQAEDIKSLAASENLDRAYVNNWINSLQLNTFNLI